MTRALHWQTGGQFKYKSSKNLVVQPLHWHMLGPLTSISIQISKERKSQGIGRLGGTAALTAPHTTTDRAGLRAAVYATSSCPCGAVCPCLAFKVQGSKVGSEEF